MPETSTPASRATAGVDLTTTAHSEARFTTLVTGRRFRKAVAFFLPFVIWQIAASLADNRLFPAPIEVMRALWRLIADGTIWFHAQLTFQRGIVGLAIAVVAGVLFGLLLARSRWAEATFEPILAATYPIPKLALFPLLVLMLGFGGASKVAMVALECAYPIIYNTYSGVQAIDKHYFWLARNVEASRVERGRLMLRAATPTIMASLRMAVPIMLVIMVVTELIGESRGLGYLIRQAGTDFLPANALAVILLLAMIGFVLDRLVVAATRRLAFWARGIEL